jgi:hypothetical protein
MAVLDRWTLLRLASRLCSHAKSAVLIALCLVSAPGVLIAAESLEYAVKAAYLSKFALYVEWPTAAFSSPNSAVDLCVAGEDPFGAMLEKAAKGQFIGGRTIVVRRLQAIAPDSGCHILYIRGVDTQLVRQIIEGLRGRGVLTVTDAHGPEAIGGIINFVMKDNRVRFEIDNEAAVQNGFNISSQLLKLALNVKSRH